MTIDLKEANGLIGMTIVSKFMPDLAHQLGYQVGFRTVTAEQDESYPIRYDGEQKTLQVACSLFDGYRAAFSVKVEALLKKGIEYPQATIDNINRLANRVVLITVPDEDGSFIVLFVQSHLDGSDTIQDRAYDYAKARAGGITKPFFNVAKDVIDFIIDGKF
jgi:hypothetical protein